MAAVTIWRDRKSRLIQNASRKAATLDKGGTE